MELPRISASTEQQQDVPALPWSPDQRVGFAIVGLGHLPLEQLLPAFGECRKAKRVALVSGSPETTIWGCANGAVNRNPRQHRE